MLKRPTYEEYDEYIIDYETTNVSFIAMASILRRKGVKNYNFFLKLYDEDLQGVDPKDPNLSMAMKMKVIMECRRNFWYFVREVMYIPGGQRFTLHRGNLAALWCCLNNIPTYLVLPRQHGKTWAVIAYALWVFNFASEYTNFLFMNKQLGDSQLNLKRLKDARSELPDYLRNDKVQTNKGEFKDGPSNVNKLSNALHNEITVKASARNPISADELGRGMTVSWVWIDEMAFLQFNRIIYMAMSPAWSKAAEVAVSKGRPIGKILTTTPSDLSTDMGKFAYEIRGDAARFSEDLYNMDSDEIATWMDKNSKNGYIYIEYNYMQLGHKDPGKWFKEQCKDMLFDWSKIRREILLQWNNASSNSPFDPEDLRQLRAMCINESENDSITINKYYKLNVYRPLHSTDRYIISVDPAKGRGDKADRTVIEVIDARTDELCAIFKSSTIQYKETFRFIYTLFNKYIPNSVIVVENNIDTIIEYIKNSTMKHALYYEPTKTVVKEKKKNGFSKPQSRDNIVYGVNTNAENRPKYFDILFGMIRNEREKICCREMIEEIETLEYKTPTRIEATSGTHDDVVLAYLIAMYVKRMGNNRARFGLYYTDGEETRTNTVADSIFASKITDYNKRRSVDDDDEMDMYNNPFWADILAAKEMMDYDDEKLAERHAKKRDIKTKDDLLEYQTNVFTGQKDVAGIKNISTNAFFELNDRGGSHDYNGFDDFGTHTATIYDDDGEGGWF